MSEEGAVDRVAAGDRWEFDDPVTAVFDNMLERSIPQYAEMRAAVTALTAHFGAGSARRVVDLGCSRGGAIAALVEELDEDAAFVGVEVSPPMLAAARERFAGRDNVEILDLDLRSEYPDGIANVTLAILAVQFIPIEYRQQLIRRVYDHTAPGGAFILVEKILGASAMLDRLMVESHLGMKRHNGYSQEEIDRKRLALEGVLVPVTAKWNVEMLETAGFLEVDCFWRWMNFAGWVALKPGDPESAPGQNA